MRRLAPTMALLLMVAAHTFEPVSAAGAISSTSIAAPLTAQDYRLSGKRLRKEIRAVFADLKKRHALASPTSAGNDVTGVLLKHVHGAF